MKLNNKLFNNINDEYSNYLFNKNYIQLQLNEIILLEEYIHDKNNPQWKDIYINGEISGYKISNTGLIKKPNNIIKEGYVSPKGQYPMFKIIFKKKEYLKSVHRLVAIAFIPNPENKREVNHINGIKTCNWYKNLEWVTRYENAQHAARENLILKGSSQPVSKFTEKQIHEVCKLLEQGEVINKIVDITGIPNYTIRGIIYNNEWKHISSQYSIPIRKIIYKNPNTKSFKIQNLLKNNITDTDEIINKLNLENSKNNKKLISKIRRLNNN